MSNDSDRGGSDLDIFEGLGKKSEKTPAAAAPPPPPGSSSQLQGARPMVREAKRTLLGIPGPATLPAAPASSPPPLPTGASTSPSAQPPASGSVRVATPVSKPPPPPPPGRGSLPNIVPPKSNPPFEAVGPSSTPPTTQKAGTVPPPISTRPGLRPASNPPSTTSSEAAQPAPAKLKNGKLDMDWDDDNEATHVYDKEKSNAEASAEILRGPEHKEAERASLDAIMSQPPRISSQIPAALPAAGTPPPPVSDAAVSGSFGALGQPRGSQESVNESSLASAKLRSNPPTSQSVRSAPPPPPISQKSAAQPLPPPPPGQVTTAPMHMPPTQRTASAPPVASANSSQSLGSAPPPHPSTPPQYTSAHPSAIPSAPPLPNLPPVSRAMEQTLLTRQPASKLPLIGALLLSVMCVTAAAVYFLMPRTGTLVVNVADSKGAAVNNLEILVDGTKRCESAPCLVREMPAGVHEVKVLAKGYEPPAPRAVTVDSRRDVPTDFQLVPTKAAVGTGFKAAAASSGVRLQVDGKDVGPLPQEMRDLEPGEHKLRFVGDRYAPLEKTISVGKDEIVDLGTINLKVLKGKATIQLGTPGAKVYLVNGTNRKEVPQFPMAIEFDPNEKWELQANKDGFEEFKEPISFDDGQAEKTFTVTLSPKGSTPARLAAPVAAPPAFLAKEPAAPAPKAAAAPVVAAQPEKKEAPPSAAAAGEAVLKINSLPASSIVLDGKPIGVTPQLHVTVSPGTHTIMFVNSEQSLKKTISVEVKAGETKAAFAKLRE